MNGAPNNTFFASEPGGREAAPGPLALVQAFANTVAEEGHFRWEAIGDPDSLRSWLSRRGLLADGERVGEADVARAKEVRKALRSLLAPPARARPPPPTPPTGGGPTLRRSGRSTWPPRGPG